MGISTVQIVLLVVFGCIAGMGSVLDSFQTHRPLIACTVVGLILGDVKTGILLGGTLEMIALGWMNIGAAQSPDSALASIISTILVVVGHQSVANGIAIALPVAVAGQVLTVFARTVTIFFQHAADKYAEDANFKMLDICHVAALVVQALRVAIPTFLVAAVVSPEGVQTLLNSIPKSSNWWINSCRWNDRSRRLRNGIKHDGCKILNAIFLPWIRNCSVYRI